MRYRGVVFGWYHQRNAGDDRIGFCLERWLHDHELIFLPHTETPPLDVLLRCDYAIIGGGSVANEVAGVFKGMRRWVRAADLPVFGIGMTVSLHPELREELRAIPESGGLLWLRDHPSAEWLNGVDGVVVAPDVTWLFPRRTPESRREAVVGVNLRPWPLRDWRPEAWRGPLESLNKPLVPWPLCFGKDDDRPVLRRALGVEEMPAEHDPALPGRTELVVAMRFHAVVFAIQAGTPFVALGNSKKLQWMLEEAGLEKASVPVERPEVFLEALDFVRANVSSASLEDLTRRLSAAAWQTANAFKERIEDQADRRRWRQARLGFRLRRRLRNLLLGC